MATIEDWLNEHVRVISRPRPNIYIQCPACGTLKAKCSINVRKGVGRCFRSSCDLNKGFNFVRLICIVDNCSYESAYETARLYQDEVEEAFRPRMALYPRDYPKNSLPLLNLLEVANREDDKEKLSLVTHAVNYLVHKRGLTLDQITRYQIGVGYEDFEIEREGSRIKVPRYGMIIVPIYFNDELISYTSRTCEVDGIRLNSVKHYNARPEEEYVPAGQVLFNVDDAITEAKQAGILTIVEDVWSAIKIKSAIATMGTNISEDQINLLVINWDGPIAICRDNDVGGRTAAAKDLEKLTGYYQDVRDVVPSGVDPDDDLDETLRRIAASSPSNPFQSNLLNILHR